MTDSGKDIKRNPDAPARGQSVRRSGYTLIRIVVYGIAGLVVFLPIAARIQGNGDGMRAYAAGTNASLSLPAAIGSQPNQAIALPIVLNTDSAVIGAVDVSLTFDPAMLALSDITPGAVGTSLKTFVPVNSAYAFDVANIVSSANTTGKIVFGAATFDPATLSPTAGYVGTTQLAVLHFTTRQAGSTAVTFSIGSSAGSTIVLEANPPQNLLTQPTQVTNAVIAIIAALPPARPGGDLGSPALPLPPPRSGVPTPPGGSPAPLPPHRS